MKTQYTAPLKCFMNLQHHEPCILQVEKQIREKREELPKEAVPRPPVSAEHPTDYTRFHEVLK